MIKELEDAIQRRQKTATDQTPPAEWLNGLSQERQLELLKLDLNPLFDMDRVIYRLNKVLEETKHPLNETTKHILYDGKEMDITTIGFNRKSSSYTKKWFELVDKDISINDDDADSIVDAFSKEDNGATLHVALSQWLYDMNIKPTTSINIAGAVAAKAYGIKSPLKHKKKGCYIIYSDNTRKFNYTK